MKDSNSIGQNNNDSSEELVSNFDLLGEVERGKSKTKVEIHMLK